MPIEAIIAPVGKSNPAFDLQTNVIFGEAKVDKFLDCVKSTSLLVDNVYFVLPSFTARSILVGFRSVAPKAAVTSRLQRPIVSDRKQLYAFLKNSAIAMHNSFSQDTLHEKVEEVA